MVSVAEETFRSHEFIQLSFSVLYSIFTPLTKIWLDVAHELSHFQFTAQLTFNTQFSMFDQNMARCRL